MRIRDEQPVRGLTAGQAMLKRAFDVVVSATGLSVTGGIILAAAAVARADTRKSGFFRQVRIGRYGEPFELVKIRTMRESAGVQTNVTTDHDVRITRLGRFFRKSKIDELPQLYNVLRGEMSFVGPRPDVSGFADQLKGDDRIVLDVRPGITGPATLAFRREEEILAEQADPEKYNSEVIYPEKVRLNRVYVQNWSFFGDLRYILDTIFG